MHKLLVLYPPPDDPAAFAEYYEKHHLPLVQKLPGLLGWRYSLQVHAEPESPYFAVFEAEFADAAAYAAAMATPQGEAVRRDVPNYATGGAIVLDYPVAQS
ncbi:EthD family reductase [Amycolatopsis sp. GA6-003]|uniref:EthD family reductase n=1 Tax=Amycolatopsis sp. GA6-003 TaxID=2652444 RepID=UPI00391729CC